MASRILSSFQKFVKIESLSGLLLFLATLLAMVWANTSPDTYNGLWATKIGVGSADFGLHKSLLLWVNDGLMAIFFFVIGLEIKRELLIGELNTFRKATFPIFAAIGGMLAPLLLYLLLNNNPDTAHAWGIPMATDIAFALAIIKLLGDSVPLSLKVFLTAFAIVDDLGAVLVIAIFYSGGIGWTLIAYAMVLLTILALLAFRGIYIKYLTVILGIVIWTLFLKSGVHPTIAGVLLAFTIPIRQKVNLPEFLQQLSDIEDRIEESSDVADKQVLSKEQIEQVGQLEGLIEQFQSPLQHLEHQFHSWVAYFIMPVFALANAGIIFSADMDIKIPLVINIAAALFVGKLIGIPIFSYLSVKLGLAELPEGIGFWQIIGVAILAGVGFTMSIFIANLAFLQSMVYADSAKIGIIIGSVISGVVGAVILRLAGRQTSA